MVVLHYSETEPAAKEVDGIRENEAICSLLREISSLLEEQDASQFRVSAYRAAAKTIAELQSPIRDVLEHEGPEGLIALPTIGQSIAALIEVYLRLGHVPLLDRLRGEANAEAFFTTLPGIGPELSHRIYETLHVETLPELDAAAQQGKLEQVPGLGRKRIRAIKKSLAAKIRDRISTRTYAQSDKSIAIDELLSIDDEYRLKAENDSLPKVAPSRFNPSKIAWLPILHTHRDDRHYTALFSNTARAHELNTTRDWVVIYRDDANSHGRWTIITSQFGKLRGCRIVRGREDECKDYYKRMKSVRHLMEMIMKKILLATDGSEPSLNAARFLARLPHDETIELTVISVFEVPDRTEAYLADNLIESILEQERERSEEAFAKTQSVFEGADVRLNSIVREGHAGETVVAVANEIHADWVVIGATGHSAISRMMLGSTSDYVATHASCSVLVVRPTGGLVGNHPLRVVIGYEPAGPAQAAIEEFAEFKWGRQTEVQVVSVIPSYDEPGETRYADAAGNAAQQLSEVSESSGRVVKRDHVGEGLVRFAEVNDIDLVVLGETPRTRLNRFLMGSMTRFVLRHAPCSVWITRNRMIHGVSKKCNSSTSIIS